MTSPAIQLAIECGLVPDNDHPAPDTKHMKEKRTRLERFYARAKAQALRDAAEISDQQDRVGATGDYLRRMAGDLEAGK